MSRPLTADNIARVVSAALVIGGEPLGVTGVRWDNYDDITVTGANDDGPFTFGLAVNTIKQPAEPA